MNGGMMPPTSPGSPTTPLTPKLTGTSTSGPQMCENGEQVPNKFGLELFLASEASAVVEHTKQVIYLEDNDIVHMHGGEYTVYNWSDVDSPSSTLIHNNKFV